MPHLLAMNDQRPSRPAAAPVEPIDVIMQRAIMEYKPGQLLGPQGRVARKLVRRQLRRLAAAGYRIALVKEETHAVRYDAAAARRSEPRSEANDAGDPPRDRRQELRQSA